MDYDNICRLDVLGVTNLACDDSTVNQNLNDRLMRSKKCWSETRLKWKYNSTSLENNKLGIRIKFSSQKQGRHILNKKKLCYKSFKPALLRAGSNNNG